MIGSAVMLPPPFSSLRCALEQAGVQIEHVARIRLAARGALQKKAHRAVRDGVLGKIVVDDQHVAALIHKVFAHGAARVGRDVL